MTLFNIDRLRYKWRSDWQTGTNYTKDDIVKYGGKVYVCLIGHTSGADSTANIYPDLENVDNFGNPAPRWEELTTGEVWTGDWQPNTFYRLNDIVKYRGIVYRCVDYHDSQATLEADIGKWEVVASTDNWTNTWQSDTDYKVNDLVKYNGVVYRCINYHTSVSAPQGLENDISNWEVVNTSDSWKGDWTTSTDYKPFDVVRYGGIIYRCVERHISSDTESDGLEDDQSKWETVFEGIEYRDTWQSDTRYRNNDVVKYSGSLWICVNPHISSSEFSDAANWDVWLPGIIFEEEWDSDKQYEPGDVVSYGGYTWIALQTSVGSIPSANDLQQNTGDWEVVSSGYNFQGDYNDSLNYRYGDVVRYNGYLYVAIDSVLPGVIPGLSNEWELLIPSQHYQGEWFSDTGNLYVPGDVVVDAGTAYICKKQHESIAFEARPKFDTDPFTGAQEYWDILVKGNDDAVLRFVGDLRTYDISDDGSTIEDTNLKIGSPSEALTVDNDKTVYWQSLNDIQRAYYVATNGIDREDFGTNKETPFRTIRYACDFILADEANRAPATIFVATGAFKEILPISVPARVTIVGDELRSTKVEPAEGYETSDMFYVRDTTTIRNMSFRGLKGELGPPNANLTRRPTAGAYVSLDPGENPDDSNVWIIDRSPYIQNVSTFGYACVGMKIDGALHNGGKRSIVANDFTQLVSDGIGYWATNNGRSELVSVFTYFCHIGYLCTDGGILRGTNGNNSYGTYGSVAEGFDNQETPILGQIDNRRNESQVEQVIIDKNQEILGIAYTHCGQNYTNATLNILGSGFGVNPIYEEFRNGGISNIRVIEEDSNRAGGTSYFFNLNTAQTGDDTSIVLSNADESTAAQYEGMRIYLYQGRGVGQYGYIDTYNFPTKTANVRRESDGKPGWDHVSVGYPIESTLNDTTSYIVEPRLSIDDPSVTRETQTLPTTASWTGVAVGPNSVVAVGPGSNIVNLKPGGTWTSRTATGDFNDVTYGDGRFVAIGDNGVAAVSTDDGDTWSTYTITGNPNLNSIAVRDSSFFTEFVAVGSVDTTAVSNDGVSWTTNTNLPTLSSPNEWTSVAYGRTSFVAVASGTSQAAQSSDNGQNWLSRTLPVSANWIKVVYGKGIFVAIANDTNTVTYSYDTANWYTGTNIDQPETFTNVSTTTDSASGAGATFDVITENYGYTVTLNNSGDNYQVGDTLTIAGDVVGRASPEDDITITVEAVEDSTVAPITDFSFTGSPTEVIPTWTDLTYANGVFVATCRDLNGSTPTNHITKSFDGRVWLPETTNTSENFETLAGGYLNESTDFYILPSSSTNANKVHIGPRAFGRAIVTNQQVGTFYLFDPGGGYTSKPNITVFDNSNTIDVVVEPFIHDGVLPQPVFYSRGSSYLNATGSITGDGFAEIYQTEDVIDVKNLEKLPDPGDNLIFDSITDRTYSVVRVENSSGTAPNIEATILIKPDLGIAEAPEHEEEIRIRQRYSQVRLTGHDFLDIGTGNAESTRYPLLYIFGESSDNEPRPFNEVIEYNGGRVFYTSSDQDGNFRVGELFEVEQSTGTITISAQFIDLQGLQELRLGGITVGGTNAVVREFSTDGSFTANSDNIIPTQQAIAEYITSRVASGGANAFANRLNAGEVSILEDQITMQSDNRLNIDVGTIKISGSPKGDYVSAQFYVGQSTKFGSSNERL